MREFFNLVFTRSRWFLGFVITITILTLLVWRLADKEGFVNSLQGFMNDIWELTKSVLTIIIMFAGLAIILGWRPFGKRKGGH